MLSILVHLLISTNKMTSSGLRKYKFTLSEWKENWHLLHHTVLLPIESLMVVLVNKQWLMYQRQAFGRQKRGSSRWQAFKDGLPKLKNWQWSWRWWWWWWQAWWWWQWWQCVGVPRWQAFKDGLPKLTDWCKTLNPRSPPLNMDASTKSHFCLKFPWYVHQKNVQKKIH